MDKINYNLQRVMQPTSALNGYCTVSKCQYGLSYPGFKLYIHTYVIAGLFIATCTREQNLDSILATRELSDGFSACIEGSGPASNGAGLGSG